MSDAPILLDENAERHGPVSWVIRHIVEPIGRTIIHHVEEVGQFTRLTARALWSLPRPPYRIKQIFEQMEFVGVSSLSIILITALFTGMVFSLQSFYAFRLFGAEGMVGSTVGLALTRELSANMCGLMVTARAGSAMAAELGTMRVTQQIDAMESMAVDPVKYLVVPRIIASIAMMPALTMVFNIVGMIGAYIIGVHMLGVDAGVFIKNFNWYVDPDDITNGLIKASVFGFILASVGCFKGFYTTGGAAGVGRATTRAVVIAAVTILIVDYFLTKLLFQDLQ